MTTLKTTVQLTINQLETNNWNSFHGQAIWRFKESNFIAVSRLNANEREQYKGFGSLIYNSELSELRRVRSICLLRRKSGSDVDKYDYGIF